MAWNSILRSSSTFNLCFLMLFSWLFVQIDSFYTPGSYTSYTISSITYPTTTVRPYQWKYIRVELPQWFSKVTIGLQSDADINVNTIHKIPRSELPVICFRDGSLPLPDNFNTTFGGLVFVPPSNDSFGGVQKLQGTADMEQCYAMRGFLLLQLTNEQISPGVWYIGLFNGIGPTRTQGRMIIRSSPFSFIASISVEGCRKPMMWGKDCNKSVNVLSCDHSNNYRIAKNSPVALATCKSKTSCCKVNEERVYSTVVVGMTEQLTIMVLNSTFDGKPSKSTGKNEIQLLCYARQGGIASEYLHDYSANITKYPLVIRAPKIGNWYFSILAVNMSKGYERTHDDVKVCYAVEMQMLECPLGRAGPNCTRERYTLQTYLGKESTLFEPYYLPISNKIPTDTTTFPLKPLLSSSTDGELGSSWTYFNLDIPRGAAGGNIHVQLTSNTKMNYEIYARFGGIPSMDMWDYYYANSTRNSQGSVFFMLYHSSEEYIDFYILYAREGTWSFGLRHPYSGSSASQTEATASFSLERCPKQCFSCGTCTSSFDTSGLTAYSYCSCDRTHGGVDCSHEIVSHGGHIGQAIFLIASNGVALLPAYWALKQKAYAEWVLFTSSGIASGLYHACDAGTWCVLSYNALQFMDFWLSFMAVVSTFLFLATMDEATKRIIHTVVAILTALIALTNATRSSNIVFVVAIGTVGLLIGWMAELSSKYKSNQPLRTYFNIYSRWQIIQSWFYDLFKKLLRRLHWGYIVVGFIVLFLAGISWIVETSETYWIWHSLWHAMIYTACFLFLCSKPIDEIHSRGPRAYELTRQDEFS